MRLRAIFLPLLFAATAFLVGCDNYGTTAITEATAAPPRGFALHKAPRPLPALAFKDEHGKTIRSSDFRGRVIVLNVWATWCAPCRQEMPTLDRLQAKLGGPDFEVVALSVDHTGIEVVKKFFRQIGVNNLRLYIDETPDTMDKLKVPGLPVTLLIDRQGRELGRLVGTTEWDSPEMVKFLKGVIGPERENRTVDAGALVSS